MKAEKIKRANMETKDNIIKAIQNAFTVISEVQCYLPGEDYCCILYGCQVCEGEIYTFDGVNFKVISVIDVTTDEEAAEGISYDKVTFEPNKNYVQMNP